MPESTPVSSPMPENVERDRDGFIVLRRTYSELYKRVTYLRKVPSVINRIIEYDIRSANTSTLRNTGTLSKGMLDLIEYLPSKERKVFIGKIEREAIKAKKIIADQITLAKMDLFRTNGIQDDDVLSIKNDAIFIVGRSLRQTVFGDIEFREKNVYAMYLQLPGLELYYDKTNDRVDIKGIRDEVLAEEDHRNGMLRFLAEVMGYAVMDRRDALRRYLIDFTHDYKAMRLPIGYYRELSKENSYRTSLSGDGFELSLLQAGEEDKDIVNGIYNYRRFVLPIIQKYI